ncbi:hypothetical protein SLS55_000382 [Diplodia seriata]|uniref:Uncharacterized protein n=1 Tax=Diplodia seriata TaxID=420778 RepID=A0ABR3CU59_9PEZI
MPFWSRRRRGMRDIDIDIAIAARADPSLLAPYHSMLSSEFGAARAANPPSEDSRPSTRATHASRADPRPAPVTQRRPASARISQLYDDIVQQLNTMAAHRRSTRTSSDESDKADEARQGTTMSGRFGAARDRATELDRSAALGQPAVNEHDYMEKTGPGSLASSVSSDGGVWIAGQAPRSPGERGYLRAAVRDMEDRFDNPSRGPEFVVMGRTIGSAVRIRFDDL